LSPRKMVAGGWWLVAGGRKTFSPSPQPPATSHHFSLFQGVAHDMKAPLEISRQWAVRLNCGNNPSILHLSFRFVI
jgi:hypothetical protein